jgi:hypothetical protein
MCGLVLIGAWPGLSWAQGTGVTNFKSSEDYVFVCKSDAVFYRCVELLASHDVGPGSAATADLYYFEHDWRTFESRALSCRLDPASVSIRADGAFLRDALFAATVLPQSAECSGSWGEWSPEARTFSVAFTDSGQYSQQSRGTGAAQSAGSEFRYQEEQYLWSVVGTGAVDGASFDGATGTVRLQRRVDVTKTR